MCCKVSTDENADSGRNRTLTGNAFPADPHVQLAAAAAAVFRSWDAPKAVSYRGLNGIDNKAGTAVTVQTMVFGNAGGESGAGVASTRNQRLARTSCISTFSSTRRARMWFPGASIWAIRTGCVSCCRPSRHG
jgi:Pyruvate phosphate dikinase, AMP/ATP-binding domain